MLSYPSDEVGNHLIDVDVMDEKGIDPYQYQVAKDLSRHCQESV
mgnify:CR=1 FL=1